MFRCNFSYRTIAEQLSCRSGPLVAGYAYFAGVVTISTTCDVFVNSKSQNIKRQTFKLLNNSPQPHFPELPRFAQQCHTLLPVALPTPAVFRLQIHRAQLIEMFKC